MSDQEQPSQMRLTWYPGALRKTVMAAAKQLASYEVAAPPLIFYEALAERAEEITNEAIADAIGAPAHDDATIRSNIGIVRRLLDGIGDSIFLATEQADDPTLARLAAHLLVEGNDGYDELIYCKAWGAHRDPEWGTIWSLHQEIRDLRPAFLFKVCMRGYARFLAVECHAPNRRLPKDLHARLRTRTVIVSGVLVLAFSAAEVEADTGECASEIGSALSILAQELLALEGRESPPREDFRPRAATC